MGRRVMGALRASVHNHRDANEPSLLMAAAKMGVEWIEDGPLDGWITVNGEHIPVEIKEPEVEGHADEFTPKQKSFMAYCRRRGARFLVWRTIDDVIDSLERLRRSA